MPTENGGGGFKVNGDPTVTILLEWQTFGLLIMSNHESNRLHFGDCRPKVPDLPPAFPACHPSTSRTAQPATIRPWLKHMHLSAASAP